MARLSLSAFSPWSCELDERFRAPRTLDLDGVAWTMAMDGVAAVAWRGAVTGAAPLALQDAPPQLSQMFAAATTDVADLETLRAWTREGLRRPTKGTAWMASARGYLRASGKVAGALVDRAHLQHLLRWFRSGEVQLGHASGGPAWPSLVLAQGDRRAFLAELRWESDGHAEFNPRLPAP